MTFTCTTRSPSSPARVAPGAGKRQGAGGEGCAVCFVRAREARLAEATAEVQAVAAKGDRVLAVAGDVTTDAGIRQVVSATVERFGGLDILVNNVGGGSGAGILDTTDEEWQSAIDLTVYPSVRPRGSPCRTCVDGAAASS